jgi:hypothetical protein
MSLVSSFFENQIKLIEREKLAEQEEYKKRFNEHSPLELARKGCLLPSLRISQISSGIGGKTVIMLEPGTGGMVYLPSHQFKVGDSVLLAEKVSSRNIIQKPHVQEEKIIGIVSRVKDVSINVAFKQDIIDLPPLCSL